MAKVELPNDPDLSMDQRGFAQSVKKYIDERIEKVRAGETGRQYDGTSDADLILELMARGYAVWRPKAETKA